MFGRLGRRGAGLTVAAPSGRAQVNEAKLTEKNRGMIQDTADDIIDLCQRAVDEANAEKRARIEAGETLTNAQKSKAVLVTYRGVNNINAETVLSRHQDLQILFKYLDPIPEDKLYEWTIPIDNIRPTLNWSGRWGPQEDAMLLVGAYKYGFGNWEAMAKDSRLGLEGKFFLEEGKKGEDASTKPIPNAIHLVRRGDYLLGILREHDEKIRAIESTLTSRRAHSSKASLSPPPPVASTSYAIRKRAESEAVASVEEGSSKKRKRRPTPTFTDSSSSDEWYVPSSYGCLAVY